VVKYLENGANPQRGIFTACYGRHYHIARYLISLGIDVKKEGAAIEFVSYMGDFEFAKYLVELGGNIDKTSRRCRTYLAFFEKMTQKNPKESTEEDLLLMDSNLLRYKQGMWEENEEKEL